jgi:predicted DNA-binding protein (UPF0251 family)
MYSVDLYCRVRLACHLQGLSQREAALRFGISRETVKTSCKSRQTSMAAFDEHCRIYYLSSVLIAV